MGYCFYLWQSHVPVCSFAHTNPLASHMIKAFSAKLCSPHHGEKQACPLPHDAHFRPRSSCWVLALFFVLENQLVHCTYSALHYQLVDPIPFPRISGEKAGYCFHSCVWRYAACRRQWLGPRPPDTACSTGEQPLQFVVVKWLPCKGA